MKKFTFFIPLFLFSDFYFSQDALFSTTNQSLVHLNPSFSGSNGFIRNQTIYRQVWFGPVSYQSFNNTFDAFIKPINGGLALSYLRDNQGNGTLLTDKIDLSYAQHFYLLDKKLKIIPSLQLTYFEKRLDYSQVVLNPMIPQQQIEYYSAKKANIDFSSGLLINYRRFYFGASVFHINQPDEGLIGFSKLPYRLSAFASYNWFLNEKTIIHLLGRLEKQQAFAYYQLAANALLFKYVIVGAGVNNVHSPFFNLGFRAHNFKLQASYQPGWQNLPYAAWEFTASFNLRNKEQRKILSNFETW